MSNDPPFFSESCTEHEMVREADGSLAYYNRSWKFSEQRFTEMDAGLYCSAWQPGKCTLDVPQFPVYEFGLLGFVDTDYESYEIRWTNLNIAGVDYMEAVWVGARQPLTEGTPEYDDWYRKVESVMAEKLPNFNMRRLGNIVHNSECLYSLTPDSSITEDGFVSSA